MCVCSSQHSGRVSRPCPTAHAHLARAMGLIELQLAATGRDGCDGPRRAVALTRLSPHLGARRCSARPRASNLLELRSPSPRVPDLLEYGLAFSTRKSRDGLWPSRACPLTSELALLSAQPSAPPPAKPALLEYGLAFSTRKSRDGLWPSRACPLPRSSLRST
jgi:hypothetical protein